jgi:dynein heavy chain
LILDPNGRALVWLRTLHKDRTVRIIQDNCESTDFMQILQKAMCNGDVVILYDDACTFDSRLETLYKKCFLKKPQEDSTGDDDLIFIDLAGEIVPYSSNFHLYLLTRGSAALELQTRCCFVNYTFTTDSLNEFFLDTVFEREKPAKRQEYLLICGREIEALSASKRHRDKIQILLSETEGNVLDNANLSSTLLELRRELNKSDDRAIGMRDMKKELKNTSQQYKSAAEHASILYLTIQQLCRICRMYQYSFDWFTRVFRLSIENSNKSNSIDKRLRYLKDHLTYSLFCQVSYSLQSEDCLIFAFLLCCRLMISEDRVPAKGLEMLVELWKYKATDDISAVHNCQVEVPTSLQDWLSPKCWTFFCEYEKCFPEMKGFTHDLVESVVRWKLLFDAKEPDNLPLHEPWYSRLSRFHKLVVVATLRADKFLELAHTFVSDHIGYKFVEPVQFDLGRIFSECDPSQPLIYLASEPNEASTDIRKFAEERERPLALFSMGGNDVSQDKF